MIKGNGALSVNQTLKFVFETLLVFIAAACVFGDKGRCDVVFTTLFTALQLGHGSQG